MKFCNPIIPNTADPWFFFKDRWYYYCYAIQDVGIFVSRSRTLSRAKEGLTARIWALPHPIYPFEEAWAPELHFIRGRWYVYVAARPTRHDLHRIFVLQSVSNDPQGTYILKGEIHDETCHWMIDGTVFEKDENLYCLWSGILDGEFRGNKNYFYGEQRLYIAKMMNPWTIERGNVLSGPEYVWEKSGPVAVNEGPQILQRNGRLFVIYSASHSFSENYCMGMLIFTGTDILKNTSWRKHPQPVFMKTDTIFGPGHASFTRSPDGTEDWITYHVARFSGSRWKRQIHAQKFTWMRDGLPHFGKPVSVTDELAVPSGEEEIIIRGEAIEQPPEDGSMMALSASLTLDREDFENSISW